MRAPLQITVSKCTVEGQYRIASDYENPDLNGKSWNDVYVNFSGYFGDINPNTFAAAPELLAVMRDFMENPMFDVAVGGNPNSVDALMKRARAAIAKATAA